MTIVETKLKDLIIIEPRIFGDERGYFFEAYNKSKLKEAGIDIDFVQDNESYSGFGVLRGMHWQNQPHSQTKLVRVVEGKIFDVAVDIRKDSPTFKHWHGEILSAENKKQMLIPKGFAHGFVVLSDKAKVLYKVDNFWYKESEAGFRFDDSEINIQWPIDLSKLIVSEKDNQFPNFKDADYI